jgi:uncharacterized membrane protein YeaQ/YmgE (transglycosylase-associated protein family)
MNAIPWLADLQDLSSAEFGFLFLAVIIGCMVTGFIVDLIMRDLGLGPAPNGIIGLIGVCAGIYLRYRFFAPYRADDVILTIGFAMGCAFVLFIALGLAKSRAV